MTSLIRSTTRSVNRLFTVAAGILVLGIMLVVLQDVIRRYLFNDPTTWALDLSSFMLCYVFFLALAPTLEAGGHVRVDIVERLLSPEVKRYVRVLAIGLVVAFGVIFLWKLYVATAETFESNEVFPTATPMPVKFIWIIGPIGAAQFVLTGISMGLDECQPRTAAAGPK